MRFISKIKHTHTHTLKTRRFEFGFVMNRDTTHMYSKYVTDDHVLYVRS